MEQAKAAEPAARGRVVPRRDSGRVFPATRGRAAWPARPRAPTRSFSVASELPTHTHARPPLRGGAGAIRGPRTGICQRRVRAGPPRGPHGAAAAAAPWGLRRRRRRRRHGAGGLAPAPNGGRIRKRGLKPLVPDTRRRTGNPRFRAEREWQLPLLVSSSRDRHSDCRTVSIAPRRSPWSSDG